MPPKPVLPFPFLTRDMLAFEQGTTFSLIVDTIGISNQKWGIRGFTKEGPFSAVISPSATGILETFTINLPDVPITFSFSAESAIEPPGKIIVAVHLGINGTRHSLLTNGTPNGFNPITWPQQQQVTEVQKRGFWARTFGANPAAGAEISDSVPGREMWRLKYVEFTLVTAAAAASRHVTLNIESIAGAPIVVPTNVAQLISETKRYIFYEGAERVNDTVFNIIVTPLPSDLWLDPQTLISTVTTAKNAGDDYGAPTYVYEKYQSPAT